MEPIGVNEDERELLIDYYIQKVSGRLRRLKNPDFNDKKRWIWELLQNAKDSIAKSDRLAVDVEVEIHDDIVRFRHNGEAFSPKAMNSLIWQKSGDKRGVDGSSGRFGTGFLTTHTLSETVSIQSNLKDANGRVFGVEFTLHRDGDTDDELREGIEETLKSRKYAPDQPNVWTEFTYALKTEVNKDCARAGLKSLEENIFLNLAFTPEINSIKIIKDGQVRCIKRKGNYPLTKKISRLDFSNSLNGVEVEIVSIATVSLHANSKMLSDKFKKDRTVSLSAAIGIDTSAKRVIGLSEHNPPLFCVFPLIGSEEFSFPVVLNSIDFEPEPERAHLLLDGDIYGENHVITVSGINKVLINHGILLYHHLLNYFSNEEYKGLHHLAIGGSQMPRQLKDFDEKWYKDTIQHKIREVILSLPIVETADGMRRINDENGSIYFPTSEDNVLQDVIWDMAFDIMPNSLPLKDICFAWANLAWEEDCQLLSLDVLLAKVAEFERISALPETIVDKVIWIDGLLAIAKENLPNELEKIAIIPTIDGEFRTSNYEDLSLADKLPKEAIDMLLLFDVDWRTILLMDGLPNAPVLAKKTEQQFVADLNAAIKFGMQGKKDNLLKAVLTLISYLPIPSDGDNGLSLSRKKIYERCVQIYGDLVPMAIDVNYAHQDFYDQADFFLSQQFVIVIEELNIPKELSMIEDEEQAEITSKAEVAPDTPFELLRWLLSANLGVEKNEQFVLNWLNDFYTFMDERSYPIGECVPNQLGFFCPLESLMGDINIPDELKDILALLNPAEDFRKTLIAGGLDIIPSHSLGVKDIAKSIDDIIKVTEKEDADDDYLEGIKRLVVDWFNHPKYPAELFDEYKKNIYNHREANSDYFSRLYFEHAWQRRDSLEINMLWTVEERRDFQKLRKVIPESLRQQLLEEPNLLNLHKELLEENKKLVQQLGESKALLEKYPNLSVEQVDSLMRIYEMSKGWDTSVDYAPDEQQIILNFQNGWKGEAYVYKKLLEGGFNTFWPNKSTEATQNVIVDYESESHYIADKGQPYDLLVTLSSGTKVYIQVKTTTTDISRADEIALPISTREWMFIGEKQQGEYFFLARVFNINHSPELYFMKLNQMQDFLTLQI